MSTDPLEGAEKDLAKTLMTPGRDRFGYQPYRGDFVTVEITAIALLFIAIVIAFRAAADFARAVQGR